MILQKSRLTRRIFAVCAVATASTQARAQAAAPQPINPWADDSSRVQWLPTNGRSLGGRHVLVWAPNDSVSDAALRALVDTLDIGVGALRTLMRAPLAWQRIQSRPVVFYLGPGRFIAHGSGTGAVFISMYHVRSRGAPFLHEASHELLAPERPFYGEEYGDTAQGRRAEDQIPLWLFEGLPDVLAQTVTAETGLRDGDVFSIGGLARVDSTCAARVRGSARGAEVLAAVGRSSALAALFTTDRPQVAPIFYACSQSLTKYFVEEMGVAKVIALFPAMKAGNWEQRVQEFAGRSVEALRSEWMKRLDPSAM
ncbi:MAG TPA: hypothetical protein VGQ52_08710 [Gemmatimonadaceae bacterium]|nr:hypothetical protein [Gemmatimonadaceae bacterium]